ncbi:unnamed protein product, partial [Allacma fusca]
MVTGCSALVMRKNYIVTSSKEDIMG